MALKVIGAGYGRTGTLSLKTALEALGFGPCYHMEDVMKRPSRTRTWQKIVHGATPNKIIPAMYSLPDSGLTQSTNNNLKNSQPNAAILNGLMIQLIVIVSIRPLGFLRTSLMAEKST